MKRNLECLTFLLSAIRVVAYSLIIEEDKEFIADHPFLFILSDKKSSLFIGRVARF